MMDHVAGKSRLKLLRAAAAIVSGLFIASLPLAATRASAESLSIVSPKQMSGPKFVLDTKRNVTRVKSSVTVSRGVPTVVAAYALVNQGTCTENGPGAWTVKKAPKAGTTSMGTETGALANGACPGVIFTFATISYTSTSAKAKKDKFLGI